jgi:uncharacterized damage-inducible protein DinB
MRGDILSYGGVDAGALGPEMIDNRYLQMMARYNRWQNRVAYEAADSLDDEARTQDRGAFFGSIQRTLSHLLWADRIWLSRFDQCSPPQVPLAQSGNFAADWGDLKADRVAMDEVILAWANAYPIGPIDGRLDWYSGAAGRGVSAPLGVVIPHIFNHQTHHRGQVHAMLTAAGCKTADSDVFLMPPTYWAGLSEL